MFLEIAGLSFLAGQYIYHRWIEDKPLKPGPDREIQIPRVDVGAIVPLIYGRTRVHAPVLAAIAEPFFASATYQMNMFFVLGIPFDGGQGTNRLHNMWVGDRKVDWTDINGMTGDGGPEIGVFVNAASQTGDLIANGFVEFLNGNPAQVLADDDDTSSTAPTQAGRSMLRPRGAAHGDANAGGFGLTADQIPGYRGYMTTFLRSNISGDQFAFGSSPTVPAIQFEASSYHTNHAQLGLFCRVGSDSNPVNVIYDLLVAKFGKLGISTSLIDLSNFQAVQYALHTESHGYSRSIEQASDADEIIQEVLKQIDGVLRWNMQTQLIELKLIRADFDPTTIPEITRYNAIKLMSFAASGWTNINNKLQLVYTNRAKDYQDDHVGDDNQANASNLDIKNPLVLRYPGICTEDLARAVAARELAARSRPLIKCRAIVDRSFLRVNVGDAVKLTWSNPDISGLIFRVANVEHGTLEDGAIALDLLQDFNFTYRNRTPRPPPGTGIDRPPIAMG